GLARLVGGAVKSQVSDQPAQLVTDYELKQNYPNPFNPSTTIEFALPKDGKVKLVVYDVLGRQVASLIDAKLEAGIHSVSFNAADLPSGVYFYRLQTNEKTLTQKMMLIK
ncbi:MAG: T9SS type A sorting domain-containing protein, partial [candidate division KSB1 bacterium]|nr:T9SS type A sorting domain-containing protein [candidate division KSB1 bacterium]